MDVPVNAELLRYGPEVQGTDAMALLADPVVELEGRLAGLQAKRQRFAQSTLRDATLRDANLRDANLRGAKVSKADLSGARDTTSKQLAQAKSLEGATMSNGQKYEDWLKSRGEENSGS
jgi:uncharacterized protein YjbI with pentapeptide repeats